MASARLLSRRMTRARARALLSAVRVIRGELLALREYIRAVEIGGIADYAYSNGDITRIISGSTAVHQSRVAGVASNANKSADVGSPEPRLSARLFPRACSIKVTNNRVIIFSRTRRSDERNYANN